MRAGNYIPAGDDAATTEITLASLDKRLTDIIQFQRDEATRRKWALAFTIGGALFAAVKLGIVVLPKIRKPPHSVGGLADKALTSNPRRRKR